MRTSPSAANTAALGSKNKSGDRPRRSGGHELRWPVISNFSAGARTLAKRILYASGLFEAWHRRRNRSNLTVVMFHRVLPSTDARFAGSNPAYTVTPDELDQCLRLFKRCYNIVSYGQVTAARANLKTLPDRALLITFDDGWQDNFQYALPILKNHDTPALLFLATDYVGSDSGFWQEEVMDAIVRGRWAPKGDSAAVLNGRLAAMPSAERRSFLSTLPAAADLPRRMLDRAELEAMHSAGIVIGGHGHTHEPITQLEEPESEFIACRDCLSALELFERPSAFSFPHGRYNAALLSLARSIGFECLFTSRHVLTPSAHLSKFDAIGRIEIDLQAFRRANNRIDVARFMMHLATQPAADLENRTDI